MKGIEPEGLGFAYISGILFEGLIVIGCHECEVHSGVIGIR